MPANQNEPINIARKVVFSNPGIPQLAPAANQQIVHTGPEASSGVPTQDALRNVSGQVPGRAYTHPDNMRQANEFEQCTSSTRSNKHLRFSSTNLVV